MYVQTILVSLRQLSGDLSGGKLLPRLTECSLCSIFILVTSHFGWEDMLLVLSVQVPTHCLHFNFYLIYTT